MLQSDYRQQHTVGDLTVLTTGNAPFGFDTGASLTSVKSLLLVQTVAIHVPKLFS